MQCFIFILVRESMRDVSPNTVGGVPSSPSDEPDGPVPSVMPSADSVPVSSSVTDVPGALHTCLLLYIVEVRHLCHQHILMPLILLGKVHQSQLFFLHQGMRS